MKKPEHRPGKERYSLRSQRSIKEQWQLEQQLASCRTQIAIYDRRRAIAEEGKERNSRLMANGSQRAYSVLESFIEDATKAEQMLVALKESEKTILREIASLEPTASQSAERAKCQRAVAVQVQRRLELDRSVDRALDALRDALRSRIRLSFEIREALTTLDFESSLDIDSARFESLYRQLPEGMASQSERFVSRFLGRGGDVKPCEIRGSEVVLPETLACSNAFRSGDSPMLSGDERREVDQDQARQTARTPLTPGQAEEAVRPQPASVSDEVVRWFQPR